MLRTVFNRLFPVFTALLIVFGLTMPVLQAQAVSRNLLRGIGAIVAPITMQQEVVAGSQLDKSVRDRYAATTNYALQMYVSSVGKRIAAQTYKNYPFSYTVLADTRTANAFAGPGGFIYVTTGMLNMLENESQLAAVLAHETGHVMRRHVVQQLQERHAVDLGVLLLGRLTDQDLDNRLTRLGEFVLFQNFSRGDELDADTTGIVLMTRAGYNPNGMVQMLEKLNRLESRGLYISFLQSHPSSEARARLAQEYIERNRLNSPNLVTDTRQFHQVIP